MSEKFEPNKDKKEQLSVGGKLSPDEVRGLLDKYGDKGLEEDPKHREYFKIGNRRIQKLKTMGAITKIIDGKKISRPKSVERRIKEVLGLEEEKW